VFFVQFLGQFTSILSGLSDSTSNTDSRTGRRAPHASLVLSSTVPLATTDKQSASALAYKKYGTDDTWRDESSIAQWRAGGIYPNWGNVGNLCQAVVPREHGWNSVLFMHYTTATCDVQTQILLRRRRIVTRPTPRHANGSFIFHLLDVKICHITLFAVSLRCVGEQRYGCSIAHRLPQLSP